MYVVDKPQMPPKRKTSKLQALKDRAVAAAATATEEPEKVQDDPSLEIQAEPAAKRIKFRNYKPHDSSLQGNNEEVAAAAAAATTAAPSLKKMNAKETNSFIQSEIQHEEETAAAGSRGGIGNKSIVAITSSNKPHYDLKAQVEPRLLKLKNRTTRAIVEMLRSKLQAENS
mgnify:CR=1 FL=1